MYWFKRVYSADWCTLYTYLHYKESVHLVKWNIGLPIEANLGKLALIRGQCILNECHVT